MRKTNFLKKNALFKKYGKVKLAKLFVSILSIHIIYVYIYIYTVLFLKTISKQYLENKYKFAF